MTSVKRDTITKYHLKVRGYVENAVKAYLCLGPLPFYHFVSVSDTNNLGCVRLWIVIFPVLCFATAPQIMQ